MPATRKREYREIETDDTTPAQSSTLLQLRNMWQFANLVQFMLLFGKALKLDENQDVEEFEMNLLRPNSTTLRDLGLAFLKFLSSHRGLTYDLFEEHARKQYLAKAPEKNPFGNEEAPARFADFDIFTKIRVLQQMTVFIMMHPERLRDRTDEQKEADQTNWRIEPYGWDRDDRTYFVLDDNRIYRMTEAPPPPPKPKKNSKKARASLRASKRRRVSGGAGEEADKDATATPEEHAEPQNDGLGGNKWECVAVSLDEVRRFLLTLEKTKDENEKTLRRQIQQHVIPLLEKQDESRKRKQYQREKELLNLVKLAHAKRSSRIAGRAEQQRAEEQRREEERRKQEEEAAARKAEQKQHKVERERDNRLISREQRLREREARREQHEDEQAQLSDSAKAADSDFGRMSERRRLAKIEKNKKALKEREEEGDDWVFDCACGAYGQIDDGTHSISCERCKVWQHSKCLGIKEEDAEHEDFHFICRSCFRPAEAAKNGQIRPKIKIKLKGPTQSSPNNVHAVPPRHSGSTNIVVEIPGRSNGASISLPYSSTSGGQISGHSNGEKSGETSGEGLTDASLNPFSSPHPALSPPHQSPKKSKAYKSMYDRCSPPHKPTNVLNGKKLSPVAASGSTVAPTKHSQPPPQPLPRSSPVLAASTLALNMTPSHGSSRLDERSSPLPPSRGGISPTKHSTPSFHHEGSRTGPYVEGNGLFSSSFSAASPSSVIVPPVALSPSPQQPNLTPPVKPAEPPRASQPLSSPWGPAHAQEA